MHPSQADRTPVSVPCHFVQTVHATVLHQTPCLENVETGYGDISGIDPGVNSDDRYGGRLADLVNHPGRNLSRFLSEPLLPFSQLCQSSLASH